MDNAFNSVLCLNGVLPNKDFFKKLPKIPIISADGATNHLLNIGIKPQIVIGDFDSIKPKIYSFDDIELIKINDQDNTDFEKCLMIINERDLSPVIICGAFGKEIDHMIHNLYCSLNHNKIKMVFYDHQSKKFCTPIFKGDYQFHSKSDEIISILPLPEATISSRGLRWELNRTKLSIYGKSSVRNRVSDSLVKINIHNGRVFLIMNRFLPLRNV